VTTSGHIDGLVLAAGAGTRFGGGKQLTRLDGRPLLEHALTAIAAASSLTRTVVVLGHDAQEILASVDLHGAEPLLCSDWREGQSASLRCGVAALAGAGAAAVVVTLGDQPFIDPRAIERVIAARSPSADAVRATYAGRPGHPVLLERSLFAAVAQLRGDTGARELLRHARVRDVACDGLGRPDDIDTPEQVP
jgi:CTP:molybdopterin cytidylyltransferase MocA